MVDPASGEFKMRKELPYGNHSGVLATAGGIVVTALLDGTIVAYDDQTLEELWKINVGSGFVAPPMTYAVDGKQYIAIASGIGAVGRAKLARSPEMESMRTRPCCSCSGCNGARMRTARRNDAWPHRRLRASARGTTRRWGDETQ